MCVYVYCTCRYPYAQNREQQRHPGDSRLRFFFAKKMAPPPLTTNTSTCSLPRKIMIAWGILKGYYGSHQLQQIGAGFVSIAICLGLAYYCCREGAAGTRMVHTISFDNIILRMTCTLLHTAKFTSKALRTKPHRFDPHRSQDVVALVQLVHGKNTTDHVMFPHEVEQFGRNLFRTVPH